MIKRRFYLILLLFLLISCLVFVIALSYRMGVFSPGKNGDLLPFFDTTPTVSPSPTSLPSPTPTPTPLPQVRIRQGDWNLFKGDYDQAESEYLSAQQSDNASDIYIAAQVGLARVRILHGKYAEAIEILNALLDTAPDNRQTIPAYYFLGQAYQARQEPALAATAYASYLSAYDGNIDAYLQELIGDMLVDAGDYTAAIASYQYASAEAQPNIDPLLIKIKIGRTFMAANDYENAIRVFMEVYEQSSNDYTRAQMNLLCGQAYLSMGMAEQAYARFQDSVTNFPTAYDSYSGLVALVEAGIPVSDLDRGIVDYYAGQYAVALDAINRYIQENPEQEDGTALYYKGLSLQALERYDDAIVEWNRIIREKPDDRFWVDCWEDIAYTQWNYQNNYSLAAETNLAFVRERPTAPEAPGMLFNAARYYETDNRLTEAADTWERLIDEYPNNELSYRALFMSGIVHYRLNQFAQSLTIFQRLLVLATTPDEQAAAYLWIGKNQMGLNDEESARSAWEVAAQNSPDSYYGIRTAQLLTDAPPFPASKNIDLAIDYEAERQEAEEWLRGVFNIPAETEISLSATPLQNDVRMLRGDEYWNLGLYTEAHNEFETLREDYKFDAITNFLLLDHFLDLGFYRSAIFTSWQIMELANIDESTAFTVPIYFNHIRYGTYFQDIVTSNARDYDFDMLFMFSLIRQESMFEGFVQSTAGARGLMQIMPATGKEIATQSGWPADYDDHDLYRPLVNIRYGSSYLARQRDFFDGDMYAALAAYNGGPGNTLTWQKIAPSDADLFLESIRYSETRSYIINITEFLHLYQKIYERPQ